MAEKKYSRAASASKHTYQRKRQRGRQERQRRILTIITTVIGGVLLIGALYFFGNQPAIGEIPAGAGEQYQQLEQSRSEEGFPILGAMDAPITLKLYTSFDCSNCADQQNLMNELLPRLRGDDIALHFVPIVPPQQIEFQNTEFATKFALCSNRFDRFWEYQEALYDWQEFQQRAYASARLFDGIERLGLDREEMQACVRGSLVENTISEATNAAAALIGFSQYGFPLFAVNLEIIPPNAPGELPTLGQINAALDAAINSLTDSPQATTTEKEIASTLTPIPEATSLPIPTTAVSGAATEPPTATPKPSPEASSTANPDR